MKLNSILKFCSRHRITCTLFVILITTCVCSVFFVQAVFGQTTFKQMFETIKFSEVFSSEKKESADSLNADETGLPSEYQEPVTPSAALISVIPPALTPTPSNETAELTAAVSPEPSTEDAAPSTGKTTQSDKKTTVSTAETTAKTAAAPAVTTKAAAAPAAPAAATAASTAPAETQPATTAPAATAPAATTAAATEAAGSLDTAMAYAVLDLTNQQRASALSWSDTLAGIAQTRAKELAVSFSHTRPDGSACWMSDCQLAENIAKGQCCASDVVTSWMNSAGHAANITNAGYTQMGVGCYYSNGVYYWAQEFG